MGLLRLRHWQGRGVVGEKTMKNFLIKMYRALPSDCLTLYDAFFWLCALLTAIGIFLVAVMYVFDNIIFWRMIHVLALLVIFQLVIVAMAAYFKDKE